MFGNDKEMAFLHSSPELVGECADFNEYCDRKLEQGDRLAELFRKYEWLHKQFFYTKRYPNIVLAKTVQFPNCDSLHELFINYQWGTIDPGKMKKPKGTVFISVHRVEAHKGGRSLYGTPSPDLKLWIDELFEPVQDGYTELFQRKDGLLVIWQANQIIASRYLAFMPIERLNSIPW